MKRLTGISLILAILITAFASVTVSAEQAADWIVGEFSNGAGNNAAEWKANSGNHKNNITDTVKRLGKQSSLKLTDLANAEGTVINSRIMKDNMTETLGKVLEYDYIYLWIYSEVANGQRGNIVITDKTTDKYIDPPFKPTIDYTGWKLHKFDISGWTLSNFNKGSIVAAETDKITINVQFSGWSETALADTCIYVDSIFFSNTDYYDVGENRINTSIKNGSTDVFPTDTVTFATSVPFKLEKNYYDGKVSVMKKGIPMTEGVSTYCEYNKLYVKFDSLLEAETEYTIAIAPDAVLNDGTAVGADGSITFTTGKPEFEIGEFVFTENGNKIKAEVTATNISEEDLQAVLVVAVFDKNTNYMQKMEMSEFKTVEDGDSWTFKAEIECDSYENCYLRAFLWESDDSMYSYGECGELLFAEVE